MEIGNHHVQNCQHILKQSYVVIHIHAAFDGAFRAFGPSIDGFTHCRPVLSINDTCLYGKYLGALLVATGVDANQDPFPLAFAILHTVLADMKLVYSLYVELYSILT